MKREKTNRKVQKRGKNQYLNFCIFIHYVSLIIIKVGNAIQNNNTI